MEKPLGRPFTRVYRERGSATSDSVRLRVRLGERFGGLPEVYADACRDALAREAGIRTEGYNAHRAMQDFFDEAPMDDVLDSITYVCGALSAFKPQLGVAWQGFCERAMREENVAYSVDEQGGVHYHVDEEFGRSRASVLSCLEVSSLAGVRKAVEDAFGHLDARPIEGKAAIRSMFEAVEIAYKRVLPKEAALGKSGVVQRLVPAIFYRTTAHAVDRKVAEGMLYSLAQWVEALQTYRHGQADVEPVEPSEELVVYALSSGCAHLRFLATFASIGDGV